MIQLRKESSSSVSETIGIEEQQHGMSTTQSRPTGLSKPLRGRSNFLGIQSRDNRGMRFKERQLDSAITGQQPGNTARRRSWCPTCGLDDGARVIVRPRLAPRSPRKISRDPITTRHRSLQHNLRERQPWSRLRAWAFIGYLIRRYDST